MVASSMELQPAAEVTKAAEVEIPKVEVSEPEPARAKVVVALARASVVLGAVHMTGLGAVLGASEASEASTASTASAAGRASGAWFWSVAWC